MKSKFGHAVAGELVIAAPPRATPESEPNARKRRYGMFAVAGVAIVLCSISTAFSLRQTWNSIHPAMLSDQWTFVMSLDRYFDGRWTFRDLIAQHNEHRLFLPRLVYLLDVWLTDARNTLNIAVILACQAVHAGLFFRLISERVEDRLLRWMTSAFVMLLLFCVIQYENFVWGFQVCFVGVYLLFSLSAYALASAQQNFATGQPYRWQFGAGLFFAFASALTMANGATALLCTALVFIGAGLLNRLTGMIAVLGLAVAGAYAATFTPNPGHTSLGFALEHPGAYLDYLATYVGGLFSPLGLGVARFAGILGWALTAIMGAGLLAGRLARDRVNLTLLAIVAFVLVSAAITGLGRISFGNEHAASSRYATPVAIFWTAITLLALLMLLGKRPQQRVIGGVALVAVATTVSLISVSAYQLYYSLISQVLNARISNATDAILSAVNDDAALRALFPDPALLKTVALPILKAHRINIFARPGPWPLGTPVPETRLTDDRHLCIGAVDKIATVQDGPDSFRLDGWAWNVAARKPFERLVILSDDRRVVGFGSAFSVSLKARDWTGFARNSGGRALLVHGLLGDGTLCRLDAAKDP